MPNPAQPASTPLSVCLPAPIRSPALFVGRAAELARIEAAAEILRLVVIYGVAGVGKTSLLRRAAEAIASRHGGSVVYVKCCRGESAGGIAAAILRQLNRAPSRDPIGELVSESSAGPIIACIDDLHQAMDPAIIELVAHIASLRLPIWILAASREALALSPSEVDHLALLLDGFEPDDARKLWDDLSELYGASAVPLEQVLRFGRVSPLRLKQAFARVGSGASDDPLALEHLTAPEKELLSQSCAFRRAAPLAALGDETSSREEVGQIVDRLVERFLVERVGDMVVVHDLVREAVARSPLVPWAHHHARCVSHYRMRSRSSADDVELLHHAVAAGEGELAVELLLQMAPHIGRIPPGEAAQEHIVAEAIDALGSPQELPPVVRALRARLRARQGQPMRAFEELRPFIGQNPIAALDYGSIAVALGRPDDAIAILQPLVADEAGDLVIRVLSLGSLMAAWRVKGDIDESRRALEEGKPLLGRAGPVGECIGAWLQGMLEYECERYAPAALELARARQTLESIPVPISLPLLGSSERAVSAALGKPIADAAGAGELFDETPYFRCFARLLRTQELLRRGEAFAAADLGEQVLVTARTHGYRPLAGEAVLALAEAERMLGRFDSALARIEATAASARAEAPRVGSRLDALRALLLATQGQPERALFAAREAAGRIDSAPGTIARLEAVRLLAGAREASSQRATSAEGHDGAEWQLARIERELVAGRLEPAQRMAKQLEMTSTAAGWRFVSCRARILGAEAAVRRGQLQEAKSALEGARTEAMAQGYAVESFAVQLLDAALSRIGSGSPGELSAEGPLARRLGLLEPPMAILRTDAGRFFLTAGQLEEWNLLGHEVTLDFVGRRAKVGRKRVNLANREQLLSLARALARELRVWSHAELTKALWGVEYHALNHHSRLTMAISRLRRILGSRLIEGSTDGYRLALPRSWAIVEPALSAAGETAE